MKNTKSMIMAVCLVAIQRAVLAWHEWLQSKLQQLVMKSTSLGT